MVAPWSVVRVEEEGQDRRRERMVKEEGGQADGDGDGRTGGSCGALLPVGAARSESDDACCCAAALQVQGGRIVGGRSASESRRDKCVLFGCCF